MQLDDFSRNRVPVRCNISLGSNTVFLPALTYYFTLSITSDPNKPQEKKWYWLIPGILDAIYELVRWIYDLTEGGGYYFRMDYRSEFFVYEGLALAFSYFTIIKILGRVRSFTYKKGPTYIFYRHAFYFLIFILFRWTTLYFLDLFTPELLTFKLYFTFWTMDICFFLFLGFKSLVTPSMYSTRLLPHLEIPEPNDESLELMATLKKDRLFLNPELGRRDLSERLNVSEIKVSSILNDQLNTTFYGLVNKLRVDEAKKLIDQGLTDQYTLEGIARESGFKSKTTFYKFFKKHTGVTPTEYTKSA